MPFAHGQIGRMREPPPGLSSETYPVGRHERPRSKRARWAVVFAGAAIMGVLLAVTWLFMSAQLGTDNADDSGTATVPTRTGSAGSTTATATDPTASPSEAALTNAQRVLAECRAHLAAREQLAQAAAASARGWRTHTSAQLKLDAGEWTLAQAQAAWDASRARGTTDVQRFAAAARAVRTGSGSTACRSVAADTASTELAAEGRSCAARDEALAAVGSAGALVNSQWAAHLTMMADKPHADAASYHDRWVAMVAQAQGPLQRYAAAAAALLRAPACAA